MKKLRISLVSLLLALSLLPVSALAASSGYTVSLSSDKADSSVSVGDSITAEISLRDSTQSVYNSYSFELRYSAGTLEYASASAGAIVKNDAANGKLIVLGYGAEKKCGTDTISLHFKAAASGAAEIKLLKANVDKSSSAGAQDAPAASISGSGVSLTVGTTAAAAVDALIDAIGVVGPDSGDKIAAAKKAYDELTEEQQKAVTKLAELQAAEAKYNLWKRGDVNLDARINANDLSLLLSSYGSNAAASDITMDGIVNANDLSLLLSNYGAVL